MPFQPVHILALLVAYGAGAIPTAHLAGRGIHGVDLRHQGSGNLGATNTFRILGARTGALVLTVDVLKGWAIVFLSAHLLPPIASSQAALQLTVGSAAVLGHIFPVYMKFKGGKGVATALGVVLAIHPWSALICLAVFLLLFLLTRYVSLGSILAACCFPILVIGVFKVEDPALVHFSWIFALLILLTHHKNIERLLRNRENKMRFSSMGEKEEHHEDH